MIYDIVEFPNLSLDPATHGVDFEEAVSIAKNMIETLKTFPSGVGLASPQVGINNARIIIVCTESMAISLDNKKDYTIMILPEIVESVGQQKSIEGCLSLGRYTGSVTRKKELTVTYMNEHWQKVTSKFIGFEASIIQHEIDHLDGKIIIDNMSKLKMNKEMAKLKKKLKL